MRRSSCPRHRCDLVDRAVERRLVGFRRRGEAAQLADELQRRRAHFLVGRRRIEVEQRLDVRTYIASRRSLRLISRASPAPAARLPAPLPSSCGRRPARAPRRRPRLRRETACGGRGRLRPRRGTPAAAGPAPAAAPAAATCDRGRSSPAAARPRCRAANSRIRNCARRLEAAVEVDRRDQRFAGVGQQRLLAAAAGLLLAAAEDHVVAEPELLGHLGERRGRHQVGLDLRLLSFGVRRERAEQRLGHDQAEHRVAEELERLVVGDAAARILVRLRLVRQRVLEQAAIAEAVADAAPRARRTPAAAARRCRRRPARDGSR